MLGSSGKNWDSGTWFQVLVEDSGTLEGSAEFCGRLTLDSSTEI